MRRRLVLVAFTLAIGACTNNSRNPASDHPSPAFSSFVDDYFKAYFEFNPSAGTSTGFHEYDTRLEDYSAQAYQNRIRILHEQQNRLSNVRKEHLTRDDQLDAEILDGQIKAELLDIEELQTWRKNPMSYVGLPGNSADNLVKRNFAPPADRLRSVIARLKQMPALFAAMKQNVANPPKEFTDLSIRIAQGSVGFFRDSIAGWAKQAAGADQGLFNEFDTANKAVVAALDDTVRYLKSDLLPRSHGDYAIGADAFRRKLLYEEMVDISLERVLAIGEANLEKDYRDFVATAKQINPNQTPVEVMKSLSANHPTEQTLIPAARDLLESLRQFLIDKKIVRLPSDGRPIVTETPPYARSGTFASMDTPGAYEQKAREAYYYITPPEKDWTPQHKEEHLRAYARPVMDLISVHEAYPGHFVQFLYVREFPTKTRKIISCGTNVEGWAHYSEQMMVEEGLGNGDPKVRLAQLSEALIRDARYMAGIKLHTQGMKVEEGAKIFIQKAFQEPANGFEESRRGAYNPTYLYYTLGKLQIYKLREDYRRAKGNSYSLEQFHDDFVKQGGIPMKIMREILLPGDAGSVL